MNPLDHLIGTLENAREEFSYFKARTKKEFEGSRFEEWVVSKSNIFKQKKRDQKTPPPDEPDWKLLEWRGDKYFDGWHPESNCYPDLILKCIRTKKKTAYKRKKLIAVECKYRSTRPHRQDFSLDQNKIKTYEKSLLDRGIKLLYYVFGIGWDQEKDRPTAIYVIPSKAIYSYDYENDIVSFVDYKEFPWDKYQVTGSYIMYNK